MDTIRFCMDYITFLTISTIPLLGINIKKEKKMF